MPAVLDSSSSERHTGDYSPSPWGDEQGGVYGHLLLPDQLASLSSDPSWWSSCALFDAIPASAPLPPPLGAGDLHWTLDDEVEKAITDAAAAAFLSDISPELPTEPTPAPSGTHDWASFGMFDSNHPTVASTSSGNSGASSQPTPATTASAGFSYPSTGAFRKHVEPDVLLKRQRNKVAAQKYRQKKLDRIAELEVEVTDVKRERDELRIQLAKQEAETAALREMLKLANPGAFEGS